MRGLLHTVKGIVLEVEREIAGVMSISLEDAVQDGLVELRAYGGTEQRNLPSGYTQVEYVDMSQGSYITMDNLPIYAGYKVEFDFKTTTLGSNLNNYLGGRTANSAVGNGFRLTKLAASGSSNNRVCMYGFESGTEFYDPTKTFTANTRYKFTYNNGVCTLESGGVVVSTKTFTVTDTSGTPRCINNYMNRAPASTSNTGENYVYSVKVRDDQGNLILNFVPVKYGNDVGLYDTVSNSFTGATAGTFTAGPDAVPVPTPTTPMDIVCNNGVLKIRQSDPIEIYTDGTVETIEDELGNTATVEMLLKVGDYVDEQEILSGDITRKVGIKVLDGTEDGWDKINNSFSNPALFADKKREKSTVFCSHFQYNTGTTSTILDGCIGCASTTTNTYFRYDTLSTVEQFQQWITDQYNAGTPVIVVYPLATSITETVTGQTMNIPAGDSDIEITQASINTLELSAKYKALPN